jgi:hypothetical protein
MVIAAMFYRLARTKKLLCRVTGFAPISLEDNIDENNAKEEFLRSRQKLAVDLSGTGYSDFVASISEDVVCDLFLPQI